MLAFGYNSNILIVLSFDPVIKNLPVEEKSTDLIGEGWALITLLLALTAFVQSRTVWSIEDDANIIHKNN